MAELSNFCKLFHILSLLFATAVVEGLVILISNYRSDLIIIHQFLPTTATPKHLTDVDDQLGSVLAVTNLKTLKVLSIMHDLWDHFVSTVCASD